MNNLRAAAQQALEVLEDWDSPVALPAMVALKAALAEPEGGGNLPPPLQEPKDFDHGIGGDRFKVVRGAFWWHVLIGDSPTEHGKFRSRAGAEKMAADLLREFRNGAFVQHEAALAEPVQEPVQDGKCKHCVDGCPACDARKLPVQEPVAWTLTETLTERKTTTNGYLWFSDPVNSSWTPLYTAPPQRPAEPVQCSNTFGCRCPKHYTAPPQRKPLTEGQQ